MNIILVAAALVVVSVGIITSRTGLMNEIDESGEVVVETETPTETPIPSATIAPTVTPNPTATPESTEAPVQSGDLSEWQYPSSQAISQGSELVLTSNDSTDQITDWYKSKVENKGFNVKSFIKTSANDVVKNVISAANGQESINVEITKDPSDSSATIKVSF